MIKFRQKEFIAPLLATAGKAALSMAPDLLNAGSNAIQNKQQNKVQQEALDNQKKQQEQQNKLLNKIAKKDPAAAASAIQQQNSQPQPQQQQFSKLGNYVGRLKRKYVSQAKGAIKDIKEGAKGGFSKKDVTGFLSDAKHALNKNKDIITGGILATGAGIAGSYIGNKAVKLYKDRKARQIEKEYEEERDYSVIDDSISKGAKKVANHVGKVAKNNKKRLLVSAGMGIAGAAVPFAMQEYMKRKMAKDSEGYEERDYSVVSDYYNKTKNTVVNLPGQIKAGAKMAKEGVKNYFKSIKNNPLKHVIKHKAPIRTEEVDKIAQDISEGGSGSKITKLLVDTAKKHKKTALIGAGILAYGAKKGADAINKKVHKGIKKLDKDAFSQESDYDNYIE